MTPAIKLWKCQTVLGCLGPKGPPSVGIGLKLKVTKEQLIISYRLEMADGYLQGGAQCTKMDLTGEFHKAFQFEA